MVEGIRLYSLLSLAHLTSFYNGTRDKSAAYHQTNHSSSSAHQQPPKKKWEKMGSTPLPFRAQIQTPATTKLSKLPTVNPATKHKPINPPAASFSCTSTAPAAAIIHTLPR
jgi:hypothetical protein